MFLQEKILQLVVVGVGFIGGLYYLYVRKSDDAASTGSECELRCSTDSNMQLDVKKKIPTHIPGTKLDPKDVPKVYRTPKLLRRIGTPRYGSSAVSSASASYSSSVKLKYDPKTVPSDITSMKLKFGSKDAPSGNSSVKFDAEDVPSVKLKVPKNKSKAVASTIKPLLLNKNKSPESKTKISEKSVRIHNPQDGAEHKKGCPNKFDTCTMITESDGDSSIESEILKKSMKCMLCCEGKVFREDIPEEQESVLCLTIVCPECRRICNQADESPNETILHYRGWSSPKRSGSPKKGSPCTSKSGHSPKSSYDKVQRLKMAGRSGSSSPKRPGSYKRNSQNTNKSEQSPRVSFSKIKRSKIEEKSGSRPGSPKKGSAYSSKSGSPNSSHSKIQREKTEGSSVDKSLRYQNLLVYRYCAKCCERIGRMKSKVARSRLNYAKKG